MITESQASEILEKLNNIEIMLACNSSMHNLIATNMGDKFKDLVPLHEKSNQIIMKIIEDNNG